MATYAEFYHMSTGWNGKDFSGPRRMIPACGSDSVIRFDGRFGYDRRVHEAYCHARKRGYIGYRIFQGNISNPKYLTNIFIIT